MFKTFSGSAPTSPATVLAGNAPTVGWVVINDGPNPILFKLDGYANDPFRIESGEMMKVPVPIADATVQGVSGSTSYRAMSFGLASLYQEYARELPAKYTLEGGGGGSSEVDSTVLANAEPGANADTTVQTNTPLVGVTISSTGAGDKFWQADRKYRLFLLFFLKTSNTGVFGDTVNLLRAPDAGGSYASMLDDDLAISLEGVAVNQLLDLGGIDSSLVIEEGTCLKVTTVGGSGTCNNDLLLMFLPIP
jgi:hypothetical protein